MFFNWFKIVRRGLVPPARTVFVEKVTVRRRVHPVDAFLVVGWVLILTKCVLASIAIHRWAIPVGDFYVWGPSVIFGGVCTFFYLTRE